MYEWKRYKKRDQRIDKTHENQLHSYLEHVRFFEHANCLIFLYIKLIVVHISFSDLLDLRPVDNLLTENLRNK